MVTTGDLARWLNLEPSELAWLSDCRTQEQTLPEGPLRHYRYQWVIKRGGSARLLECPKQRLKLLQRHVLSHLPQGAPTSPALANLAAFRLDLRLHGLATAAGAVYTRYADDLVFSGDGALVRMVGRFYVQVCAIALEEGFAVQTRKTRIMRRSVSQRAAGLVLNDRLNTPRREFECLKAILHNCVVQGADGQNRAGHPRFKEHLAGRIAHLESVNPQRGIRLRREFDRIIWPESM